MSRNWTVGRLASYRGSDGRPTRFIYRNENDSHETRICIVGGVGDNGEEFDADVDAELIVRAVNSHDEMLAALKAIVARRYGVWDDPNLVAFGGALGIEADDIERIARAAIAKAEGRS